MNAPIPEFLWLRDYEERLEFVATKHRDRVPAAFTPPFMLIR
ncbi:hypothetical protein [Pengzhenrongella sicca]|nr:hypothetical protein [Pengzhenrongella sicca]